jgi:hypothetical protein
MVLSHTCNYLHGNWFVYLNDMSFSVLQIGILQNVPHQMGSGAPDANDTSYGGHAYAVGNPMQGSSSGPDLTSLFVTSQTKSDKERESETTLSYNNNSNGTDLPPEYNSVKYL